MNIKELEQFARDQAALINELRTSLQAAQEAHMHLVQRADNIVEGFKQELAGRDERIQALSATVNEQAKVIVQAVNFFESWPVIQEKIHDMGDHQDGMNDTLFGAVSRIDKLETLVLARNASAATKRNMTDEDALTVLTGDLKGLSHKDAAEKIGLTYAQVYSCRLEFTFKHVHKNLRDNGVNNQPWKNPWAK